MFGRGTGLVANCVVSNIKVPIPEVSPELGQPQFVFRLRRLLQTADPEPGPFSLSSQVNCPVLV